MPSGHSTPLAASDPTKCIRHEPKGLCLLHRHLDMDRRDGRHEISLVHHRLLVCLRQTCYDVGDLSRLSSCPQLPADPQQRTDRHVHPSQLVPELGSSSLDVVEGDRQGRSDLLKPSVHHLLRGEAKQGISSQMSARIITNTRVELRHHSACNDDR